MSTLETRNGACCAQPTVFMIDNDAVTYNHLTTLCTTENLPLLWFESAELFLNSYSIYHQGCLIIEIALPGKSGLELQRELAQQKYALPIIFLTHHSDVPTVVMAMQQGAIHFYKKPLNDHSFITTVRSALDLDRERRQQRLDAMRFNACLTNLTRRERQVFDLVIQQKSNRDIMGLLDIQLKTVEFHRARMMEKMHAASVIELIELARRWL